MSYKYWRIFATFLLALGLMAACSSQPVNNPSNLIPVKTNVQALTLGEINTTIVDACRSRGWVPTAINQGIVQCNITVRGRHKALVNIHFDEQHYTIEYADSEGLDYRLGKIHRNYNKWVILLGKEIDTELNQLVLR
jgi:hypothetical protein